MAFAERLGSFLGLDVTERTTGAPAFDFFLTAWIAVALLGVRLACEKAFIPLLRSSLKLEAKKARATFDDAFIATFSAILVWG